MESKEQNSRNRPDRKPLLSVFMAAAVFVFTDGDDDEQPDAAASPVREPGRDAAPGPKHSPEPVPKVFCEDEDTPEYDIYDANEDPMIYQQLI